MKASPEQIISLRTVARALGPKLCDEVVFVGGMVTGLLVTDRGAPPARMTADVDLVVPVTSTAEYQSSLRKRLRARGFREDTRERAPVCRWIVRSVVVDVMPTKASVLGFTNAWYPHAIKTATRVALPPDEDGAVDIPVVSAPTFCATKLAAWASRGAGDLLHTDIEDVIAVIDGRAELLEELEAEAPKLRQFIAESVSALLRAGLEDQLPGHLRGDAASQARMRTILTVLRRMARNPKVIKLGERVTASSRGEARWDYEITSIEPALASKPRPGSSHIAVLARLTSHGNRAGTAADGRNVLIEDSIGRHFPPLYKLLHDERARRGMARPYDQVLPREPFDTAWGFEVPADARALRLLLPFDHVELPFERPA